MRELVNEVASRVGADPMLVQGPGGNISWKDGDVIFVKGSGTCLADALRRNIYVEIDLIDARQIIFDGKTDFLPTVRNRLDGLYPSIETAMHVLLPQQFVLHIHPVDVITQSVMPGAQQSIATLLADMSWAWVDYVKPGKELAAALCNILKQRDIAPKIWVLGNHGLVIADEDLDGLNILLKQVLAKLCLPARKPTRNISIPDSLTQIWAKAGYRFIEHDVVAALAFDDRALNLCREAWALYPDHVVFLGDRCCFAQYPEEINATEPPLVVVVAKVGVCLRKDAPAMALDMLTCYANILLRLPDIMPEKLSSEAVAELLAWDAEKIRVNMQMIAL